MKTAKSFPARAYSKRGGGVTESLDSGSLPLVRGSRKKLFRTWVQIDAQRP